jgi:hypothetical protein
MLFGNLLRLVTGFLAITTPLTRALGSHYGYDNYLNDIVSLPFGCEDFVLLEGNPAQAENFYLLESHNKCDTRIACTTALLNQKFENTDAKSQARVLFEEAAFDQNIICKEYGLGDVVTDSPLCGFELQILR